MGTLMGQLTLPPPNGRVNSLTRMAVVFPPNRVIKEGEPLCELCGSGWSTHEDGSRAHPYQGRRPFLIALKTFIRGLLR